jgi:hypothetical protein
MGYDLAQEMLQWEEVIAYLQFESFYFAFEGLSFALYP